jgi:hypothetical protein
VPQSLAWPGAIPYPDIMPKMLARLINAARRRPALYKTLRGARMTWGNWAGARAVPGIPGRVHHNDLMLGGEPNAAEHYVAVGEAVVTRIDRALAAAHLSWDDVRPALEIGSNYGRILRQLLKHIPAEQMHVSDIIAEATAFCAREFGVTAWPEISDPAFEKAPKFKLIILISVFTHLSDAGIARILQVIERHTASGGVLFFTTHGAEAVRRVAGGWHSADKGKIEDAVAAGGSYYIRAEHWEGDVGTSWHHPDCIRKIVAGATTFEEVDFEPAGLDRHQDIFVWRKPN